MWHLGMATGIDHAETEVKGNRAAGKKAVAPSVQAQQQATSPPPQPPPPPAQGWPSVSAWVGPPAAGRAVNGEQAAMGDAVSLDEQGPRWHRPVGEER
jgi:hypothetical protein